jgi:nitroreductase
MLEALHSTPACRYLAPGPIPDDVLWAVLDAAIRGPSGGDAQHWGWVVVTDQQVKDRVAAWYRDNREAAYGSRREQILSGATGASGGLTPRGFLGAEHLAQHVHEAPVWVSRSAAPRRPARRRPLLVFPWSISTRTAAPPGKNYVNQDPGRIIPHDLPAFQSLRAP